MITLYNEESKENISIKSTVQRIFGERRSSASSHLFVLLLGQGLSLSARLLGPLGAPKEARKKRANYEYCSK